MFNTDFELYILALEAGIIYEGKHRYPNPYRSGHKYTQHNKYELPDNQVNEKDRIQRRAENVMNFEYKGWARDGWFYYKKDGIWYKNKGDKFDPDAQPIKASKNEIQMNRANKVGTSYITNKTPIYTEIKAKSGDAGGVDSHIYGDKNTTTITNPYKVHISRNNIRKKGSDIAMGHEHGHIYDYKSRYNSSNDQNHPNISDNAIINKRLHKAGINYTKNYTNMDFYPHDIEPGEQIADLYTNEMIPGNNNSTKLMNYNNEQGKIDIQRKYVNAFRNLKELERNIKLNVKDKKLRVQKLNDIKQQRNKIRNERNAGIDKNKQANLNRKRLNDEVQKVISFKKLTK